jgi:hypothetical protein
MEVADPAEVARLVSACGPRVLGDGELYRP